MFTILFFFKMPTCLSNLWKMKNHYILTLSKPGGGFSCWYTNLLKAFPRYKTCIYLIALCALCTCIDEFHVCDVHIFMSQVYQR